MYIISKIRNWRLTSYLSEEQILKVIEEHETQIKAYAYALHDKDIIEETGEIKTPHYHILLALHNGNTLSGVLNWFSCFTDDDGREIHTLGKEMNNRKGAYAYLTHNTVASQNKYQYDESIIKSVNGEFFQLDENKEDLLSLAVEDLLAGTPLRVLASRYGRDFIIHYNHIKSLYIDIKSQEERSLKNDFERKL